jgi:hypothetical protein
LDRQRGLNRLSTQIAEVAILREQKVLQFRSLMLDIGKLLLMRKSFKSLRRGREF